MVAGRRRRHPGFVNEIVTEEESDQALPGGEAEYISHFDMYRQSMSEIGADLGGINDFINCVAADGLARAWPSARCRRWPGGYAFDL